MTLAIVFRLYLLGMIYAKIFLATITHPAITDHIFSFLDTILSHHVFGGHCSPQLPVIYSYKQFLFHYYPSQFLFCYPFTHALCNQCSPLSFNMPCECQIFQAHFSHNASHLFQLSLILIMSNDFLFVTISLKPASFHMPSMIFSESFCRTTSLLSQITSSLRK